MRLGRGLFVVFVALCLASASGACATEPDLADVDRLIDQLGSSSFIERQVATETLSTMGLSVVGPIKDVIDDPDPEVRFRARQILRVIRHVDRQRLINAFIAGVVVDADAELPGWQQFQQVAGVEEHARQLYVQMLEEEWEFLDAVYQSDPQVASTLVMARIVSLELASRRKNLASVGSIASLLLVAAHEDIELTNQANLMSLCYRSTDFDAAIRSGPAKGSLRALLGGLISRSSGVTSDPYLTQRFHFSLYYNLSEGLEPARQVVRDRLGIPHLRQYAILVLGKMGDKDDEEMISQSLDDAGVITSRNRVNRRQVTTQVRDVALAVLIQRNDEKFADYGLEDVKPNATTLLQLSTVGFVNDQEREQAIGRWRQKN